MDGWIKLYRKLLDDVIWIKSTNEQKAVLITLLLLASHTENEWEWQGKKFKVMPGQFVTSTESIIKKSGNTVTRQNVRTALEKFKKFDFLTYNTTKTGTLITINNWGKYQDGNSNDNQDINQEVTNNQPRGNQEVTTINNDKKYKNVKNDKNNTYIVEILDYLNKKINSSYKSSTKKTKDLIMARIKEGFTVEDFKTVIDKKSNEWIGTEWEKYLRPSTLFGTKFESYLNQVNAATNKSRSTGDELLEMIRNGEFDEYEEVI